MTIHHKQERIKVPKIKNALIRKFKFEKDEQYCEIPVPSIDFCWTSNKVRNIRSIAFMTFLIFYCLSVMVLLTNHFIEKRMWSPGKVNDSVDGSTTGRGDILPERQKSSRNDQASNRPTWPTIYGFFPASIEEMSSKRIIATVSEPRVHKKALGAFGAWMKDPGSADDKIFLLDNYYHNNRVIVYKSMNDFRDGSEPDAHTLPHDWGGTGHAVFNDHLYYNKYNTSRICKYSFSKRRLVHSNDLPRSGFGNMSPYQWAGSTDIDFSVSDDELFVIYATADRQWNITISSLNEETLEVNKTWHTNFRKRAAGNAFIANKVLYTVQRYDASKTSLNYAFDMTTSHYFWPKIPLMLKYGSLSSLDYNHKEKQLYGWDRGYQVTYEVNFN